MWTSTPTKQQRTKNSVIRTNGKADVELCIRLWIACRRRNAKLSCREFARLIGEAPSTVRYILNKGTSAGHLAHYLPNQKRWDYYDLSPDFALLTSQRRASNKGPSQKVKTSFLEDFIKAYVETKSVTYALKLLAEKPHDYFIPSRSTIYRLLGKGELRDKDNNPLPYKRYKRPHPKPAPTDHPRNHAPKHMINELSSIARNHLEPLCEYALVGALYGGDASPPRPSGRSSHPCTSGRTALPVLVLRACLAIQNR